MSTPQTVTVTWTDPPVVGAQRPLQVLYVWENDLTQDPPTQAYIGSVAPGRADVHNWSAAYRRPAFVSGAG